MRDDLTELRPIMRDICQRNVERTEATRGFVAVGIQWHHGAPSIVLFHRDEDAALELLRQEVASFSRIGTRLLDRARITLVPATNQAGPGIATPTLALAPSAERPQIGPGWDLKWGSLGCALRPAGLKDGFFLTASHFLENLSKGAEIVDADGHPVGAVEAFELQDKGDWVLIRADCSVQPTSAILADRDLRLTGPLADTYRACLSGQVVTISGAARKRPTCGTVVAVEAYVAVDDDSCGAGGRSMLSDQLLIKNLPTSEAFANPGDSGSVAYTTASNQPYPLGTAIGLINGSSCGNLTALTWLPSLLTVIDTASGYNLDLWS